MKPTPYPHIKLFKNKFLEKFSYVHPIVPACLYIPCVILLTYFGYETFWLWLGFFGLGLLSWSFLEYLLHRFIFHGAIHISERLGFIVHGIHHEDPHDPLRLVAPPALSLIILAIISLGIISISESNNSLVLLSGLLTGYLIYDYLHYFLHHGKPKTKLFKKLHRNHMLHHFKQPNKRYGVSSPLWDIIFRTY